MDIVTEIAGNAASLLAGAISALEEAKRQVRFANPPDLPTMKKLDTALTHAVAAMDAITLR
jgi:hypothetical protein